MPLPVQMSAVVSINKALTENQCFCCAGKAQIIQTMTRDFMQFLYHPAVKTGKCYNLYIWTSFLHPQLHSESKYFYSTSLTSKNVQKLFCRCYQHSSSDTYRTNWHGGQRLFLKGWILWHQQPRQEASWWQGISLQRSKRLFWFVDYVLWPLTLTT